MIDYLLKDYPENDFRHIPPYRKVNELIEIFKQAEQRTVDFWTRPDVQENNGGFHVWFDENGKSTASQFEDGRRSIINQLRVLYMHAIQLSRQPQNEQVRRQFESGLANLNNFRDAEGRYYSYLDKNWQLLPPKADFECVFSEVESINAIYLIYMMAEIMALLNEPRFLQLAEDAFMVLEKFGWDSDFGGYFNVLEPDKRADYTKNTGQNMHAAIALSRLYKVSPKPAYLERIKFLYWQIAEKTVSNYNFSFDYMTQDWQMADYSKREKNHRILAGHNAEVVWYLEDVAKAATLPYHHNLLRLRDGVFNLITPEGYFFIFCGLAGEHDSQVEHVVWWGQFEIMISLLRQYQMFGTEEYLEKFWQVTKFTFDVLMNPDNGIFYGGRDFKTKQVHPQGGWAWKGGLHVVRALQECVKVLEKIK